MYSCEGYKKFLEELEFVHKQEYLFRQFKRNEIPNVYKNQVKYFLSSIRHYIKAYRNKLKPQSKNKKEGNLLEIFRTQRAALIKEKLNWCVYCPVVEHIKGTRYGVFHLYQTEPSIEVIGDRHWYNLYLAGAIKLDTNIKCIISAEPIKGLDLGTKVYKCRYLRKGEIIEEPIYVAANIEHKFYGYSKYLNRCVKHAEKKIAKHIAGVLTDDV